MPTIQNYRFLFLLLITLEPLCAQKINLSGVIRDAQTGEQLGGATLYELTTNKGTTSNNYGFYSLDLSQRDSLQLLLSFLGYKSQTYTLTEKTDQSVDFELQPVEWTLEEVELTAQKVKTINQRIEIGVNNIQTQQIEKLPALGGEVDLLKALQLLPGVQSGNEGTSGLYVRGGSPDQNLMLLDDVPLYYVNHLGGFVSTFNVDAIKSVKLTKGGFPARYGGRLSSIVDIRMKEGNRKAFKGSGLIGIVASKIAIEGPIKKDTTSYILSARRFLYDLITRPFTKIAFDGISVGYTFHDINAKINHQINKNNQLYFSSYIGNDRSVLRLKGEDFFKNSIQWGNQLAALRWNRIFGNKLFLNTTLSYTRYRYKTQSKAKGTEVDDSIESVDEFFSGIKDFSVKMDFEYFVSSQFKLAFGGQHIDHTFTPGISRFNQKINGEVDEAQTTGSPDYRAWEQGGYLENEISLGKGFSANLGLRYNHFVVNQKAYPSLEPRGLVKFSLGPNSSLKAAYSIMQQNVHLLTSSGTGIPIDLWVPPTKQIAPQKSKQWSLGYARVLNEGQFEFSMEGYHKKLTHLIAYKEGARFIGNADNWETLVEKNGKGEAYGIELLLDKKKGLITGWIGYTWSHSTRQFDGINQGKKFFFRYDKRHDLSITANHKLNEKIDVAATWVYSTGGRYTLPISKYYILSENIDEREFEPERVHVYAERNANRLRDYHRLDLGINFRKNKKWGERIWNVSLYNAYNRQNAYFNYIGRERIEIIKKSQSGHTSIQKGDFGDPTLKQQSLFPIIPSVSYSFTF
jgi:hypothetical protein